MSNAAAGKTDTCLQTELTKLQTIHDKDEPFKRWCACMCVCVCILLLLVVLLKFFAGKLVSGVV